MIQEIAHVVQANQGHPTLPSGGSQNVHSLDLIGFHHQLGNNLNSIPTDPFAEEIEHDLMYVPEVANIAHTQEAQATDSQQENAQGQQGEDQQEMFDDIVANTNPVLETLQDARL